MAKFKEIGRIQASKATDIVLSQVIEGEELKGLNLNTYITTEKYTGFTKGVFVPEACIEEFKVLIGRMETL